MFTYLAQGMTEKKRRSVSTDWEQAERGGSVVGWVRIAVGNQDIAGSNPVSGSDVSRLPCLSDVS